MSIYGAGFSDESNLSKFGKHGSTINALVERACVCADMPYFVDNYKPQTVRNNDEIISFIHSITEGGTKQRLYSDGRMAPVVPLRCFPIFTGEDTPDHDPAMLARMIVVYFPRFTGGFNEKLGEAQKKIVHLPAVGAEWLRWLQTQAGKNAIQKMKTSFTKRQADWSKAIRETADNYENVSRIASNLAYMDLAFKVVSMHPRIKGALGENAENLFKKQLAEIAGSMGKLTSGALEARQFIESLYDLLQTGRAFLLPKGKTTLEYNEERYHPNEVPIRPEQVIGSKDEKGFYILTKLALQMINRGEERKILTSPRTLFAQLREIQALGSTGSDATSKQMKHEGKNTRMLHLAPNVFDDLMEE